MAENGYKNTRQKLVILTTTATTGTSGVFVPQGSPVFYSVTIVGTGAVGSTTVVEADTGNGTNFTTMGTITLSGTTQTGDGFHATSVPPGVRFRNTAISGTAAAVTFYVST